ncbi:putative glycoside hydrolase [Candidatus Wolfebacteria bacterium]|nr:putative glycoside hydrolase [Candidatus Wolfebacteria bacterium]
MKKGAGKMLFVGILGLGGLLALYGASFGKASITYDPHAAAAASDTINAAEPSRPNVTHLPTPEPFKAIYMTQCVAGTPDFRQKLVNLIETTELNAVIIDIKDFSGTIGIPTTDPRFDNATLASCGAADMREFVEALHSKDIYVVGRITVFQDPLYTNAHPELAVLRASDGSVWKDFKGLSFVDVGAREYWDYVVELSREAYTLGFDELNYDYIRYPSDGNMKDIAYPWSGTLPKADALEGFFAYLYENVRGDEEEPGPLLSADLFGYTTTNTDDLGIGQLLERTLPYFDYVMPMVYPSHYNAGFIGIEKPATRPYEVVKYSMESAVTRARVMKEALSGTGTSTEEVALRTLAQKGHGRVSQSQLRPWLQDFDLGATYTPEMVKSQIQATYDAGLTSWALWDAGNTYTHSALLDE